MFVKKAFDVAMSKLNYVLLFIVYIQLDIDILILFIKRKGVEGRGYLNIKNH